MSGLHGIFAIADDLLITGSGDTMADTERDHAHNLQQRKQRCKAKHIKLNAKKGRRKKHTYPSLATSSRLVVLHLILQKLPIFWKCLHPKIYLVSKACVASQQTENVFKQLIKRFWNVYKHFENVLKDVSKRLLLARMVQYLAKFPPNLANDLTPLRNLNWKGVPWEWTADCERTFHTVKQTMTNASYLVYYNPDDKLTLQADNSKDVIAAMLLQQGKPIEFASRALTPAERNWAQIEKEALAVLFGLEHFHQYTYGHPAEVVTQSAQCHVRL